MDCFVENIYVCLLIVVCIYIVKGQCSLGVYQIVAANVCLFRTLCVSVPTESHIARVRRSIADILVKYTKQLNEILSIGRKMKLKT